MYIIKNLGIPLLFISSLLFTFNSKVNAQNYLPFNYWTFDASNSMDDSMNHNSLNPTFYNSPYSIVIPVSSIKGEVATIILEALVRIKFLPTADPEFPLLIEYGEL